MSVLKVGALRSPSASSNNIVLNSDGTISSGDGGAIPSNTYVTGTFVSNNYYEAFKLTAPTITSIHPSTNVSPGDTVYIVGTGFDRSANVMLVSNSNLGVVVGRSQFSFNDSANITIVVPDNVIFYDEDYDVRVTIDNTGLAAVVLDGLDLVNTASLQGSYAGYVSGGVNNQSVIDKFPFATDTNITAVGNLSVSRGLAAGQSSTVSGYSTGGSPGAYGNVIDKFPFAADGDATDVGNLTTLKFAPAGHSSTASGYTSGGVYTTDINIIDKFPFSTDANATDVGDLTVARGYVAGQSSTASGYTSGGRRISPSLVYQNVIDKFPFATDANATDVGDLSVTRTDPAGQSSTVSGYSSGGSGPVYYNTIDKFPFATDANATDVGDLTESRAGPTPNQSTVSGYSSGGLNPSPSPAYESTIDKFPFATDANATDVGDLTIARSIGAGQQI